MLRQRAPECTTSNAYYLPLTSGVQARKGTQLHPHSKEESGWKKCYGETTEEDPLSPSAITFDIGTDILGFVDVRFQPVLHLFEIRFRQL